MGVEIRGNRPGRYYRIPMACLAFHRDWFVIQDRFAFNEFDLGVAFIACHIGMPALQRKTCPLVVVKLGWDPALLSMTVGALRLSFTAVMGQKLPAVWVGVARLAVVRCALELDLFRSGPHFVTSATSNRPVSSQQWESRLGVVEAAYFGPGAGVMAGFAAECGSV